MVRLTSFTRTAGLAAFFSSIAVSTGAATPPPITLAPSPDSFLQTGNPADAYWASDNRWGAGNLIEGSGPNNYEQSIGISNTVGPAGEVAFRTRWRWPVVQQGSQVKGYPALISGRKPGHLCTTHAQVACYIPVKLPDGTNLPDVPAGATPGTGLPKQLPLSSLTTKFAYQYETVPTGVGQLTYDIWLQSQPVQDYGFSKSSITHEIMIPLSNWGNYGAHNSEPYGRNQFWYDHDVTLSGKLYHVYATKTWDPQGPNHEALLYNFGSLAGTYGKTGWKMIAFLPAQMPVAASEIDLAAIINHVATRKDKYGNPWAVGNEWVSSVELGVEPVEGTGDVVVYDYKVSTGTAAAPAPTPTPVSCPANPPTWSATVRYDKGAIVAVEGGRRGARTLYLAKQPSTGKNPLSSPAYWSKYLC